VARSINQRTAAGAICDQRAGTELPVNPAHPDAAKVIVAEIFLAPFDSRLLK
jgi:hypothetical protein